MDFFVYMVERGAYMVVASIPLILTFVQLKVFKLSSKAAASCLLLTFILSLFFWLKLRELTLALYQAVPYLSSFVWIWAENVWQKRRAGSGAESDSHNR